MSAAAWSTSEVRELLEAVIYNTLGGHEMGTASR